ncbi:hypothetical protein CKM354_000686500 [Cercospora kikuchii]|uniref:Uncharacterized protein n=1 Tax=Cercospora kikuchii TaxID=84275 RepID=A0A9P3CSP0_9PEZI|nr:uncharacterized protein CKM354_000686500 [Cercospora kikuchii]GIZ43648.1 hypothetical protein CKM354_000686500 [Cercospora kikuchii]
MFVDDRPLSTFGPTQGWNMYQPVPINPPHKKPPIGTSLYTESKASTPPLLSKTSSSSSLRGLEKNIPPFQTFLLRTPPLEHNHDKPLPAPPIQAPRSDASSERRRSSSVYSRTPSNWAPDSVSSWQTDDLQGDIRMPERSIAYSSSVPDLKAISVESDTPAVLLEPRAFDPLLTSPTVSTIVSDNSPSASRPATTLLPQLEKPISPAKSINTISLAEAKEAINSPGAQRLLPEELLARTMSKTKSMLHSRATSADPFGMRAVSSSTEYPISATFVDRQGRTRSITTPPAIASHPVEYPLPAPYSPLPSVNAFHVGSGPARDMVPPTPTVISQPEYEGRNVHEPQRERNKPSFDLSAHNIPPSPETFVPDAYRFQLGDEPKSAAEEYHTALAQNYRQPNFDTTGYDSDDSIRRHMKMIPQPLFSGKDRVQKPTSLRKSSGASRYRPRSSSQISVASSRGSNSFDLRLSVSTADSRHASGGSGFGHIPISPPSTQHMHARRTSVERGRSLRTVEHQQEPDPRTDPIYNSQSDQQVRRGGSVREMKSSKPSFSSRLNPRDSSKSRPSVGTSAHPREPESGRDSEMGSPTLGTAFAPAIPSAGNTEPGAPLLSRSVIEMKLKTPQTSPQTSPLGDHIPSPSSFTGQQTPNSETLDDFPIFNKKPFFQRVGMKSLRKARRRSSTATDRSVSPSSVRPSPQSPHLYSPAHPPFPTTARKPNIEVPHLGWSRTSKQNFDEAVSPPGTPTNTSRAKLPLLSNPFKSLRSNSNTVEHADEDGSTSPMRKGSILGSVLERFTHDKGQKRREDLKKLIRVVPNVSPVVPTTAAYAAENGNGNSQGRPSIGNRASTEVKRRSSLLQRRRSAYGWM